jgi:drug/metabolite transporter (DMT)-like permease
MKLKNTEIGYIYLLIAAFIWGIAFVAQSTAMLYAGPFFFQALRFTLGTIVLIPTVIIKWRYDSKKLHIPLEQNSTKTHINKYSLKVIIIGGLSIGIALSIASIMQQVSLKVGASAGQAGFLTSLYLVFVPIALNILGKPIKKIQWFAAIISLFGVVLLSLNFSTFKVGVADIILLASAIVWTVHILLIDYFVRFIDPLLLSLIQFAICSVVSWIGALLTNEVDVHIINKIIPELFIAGVLSIGVAFTLQVLGQKKVKPNVTTLIISLESVIAAASDYLILKNTFTVQMFIGAILILSGILMTTIKNRQTEKVF